MKKYRVTKKYKKPIMNANRLIELRPLEIVYLKYEPMVKNLLLAGHLVEIHEVKKRPIQQVIQKQEIKIKTKKNESKAEDKEVVLENNQTRE